MDRRPSAVNYIDCRNTEKPTLKFRELSRELSTPRDTLSTLLGGGKGAAVTAVAAVAALCSPQLSGNVLRG